MVLTLGFLLLIPTSLVAQESGPTVRWQSLAPADRGGRMPFLEGAEVFNDDLKVSGGDVYDGRCGGL